MKRRADVQRRVQILSKLSAFALNPKMPAGTKKNGVPWGTPFLLNNRTADQSAPLGSSMVRCAMEMLRASGPKTIRTIKAAATIPTTSISE